FVDPSGLNKWIVEVRDETPFDWDLWRQQMFGWGINTNVGTRDPIGIDPVGGRDREVTAEDKLPFNSCAEFVNYLAGLATSVVKDVENRNLKGKALRAATTKLGIQLMSTAYFEYDKHSKSNGYAGFKDNLVKSGEGTPGGAQGANVYGHLLGFAGAYLNEVGGGVIALFANEYDNFQVLWGNNKQAPSEVAGNAAGTAAGQHMWNYISGRSSKEEYRLKNSLTSELCK
ncbi:MAG TPA: hypothetical protein VF596_07795, partial [Pyrinomonadaceae bacterium]